jgi:uncharacterized ferredoxin-like protein
MVKVVVVVRLVRIAILSSLTTPKTTGLDCVVIVLVLIN